MNSVYSDEISELFNSSKTEEQAKTNKVINTESTVQKDRKILQRIKEIYSELEHLNNITVDVSKGVVTLSGEMRVSSDVLKAMQIARQVDGVVEVENNLTVNQKLSARLYTTYKNILILGNRLFASLPLIVLSITTFILFWFIGSQLSKRQKFFRRISPNYFIATLLGQIAHLFFVILGLVLALILLDATALLSTILGAAGIFSLAIGFAVRDTVENYIASILLSIRNPFEVNDLINIDGHEGNVARLTSRATILVSPNGNHIRIPNSVVYKSIIINYTRHPERRFQFDVSVYTEHDLHEIQALALQTLKNVEGLCDKPEPQVIVHKLGDSNVTLQIFAWVDQDKFNYLKIRSNAIIEVKQAFDSAGIVMSEPVYNLLINNKSKDLQNIHSSHDKTVKLKESVTKQEISNIQDVSVDRTVENKVLKEQESHQDENLLSKKTPKEF